MFVAFMVLAPLLPYGPEQNVGPPLQPPSFSHPFGTDSMSFDVFTRVVYAARVDILVALAATAIAFTAGSTLGVIAGFLQGKSGFPGWFAEGILRVMDLFQAFPIFVLALALVAATGASLWNVIAAIAFVNHPVFARQVRAEVLARREAAFIEAAVCSGNKTFRLALRHLLPNAMPTALVLFSVNLGFAILLTAGLSFVGAGVRIPTAEWGIMVSQGARNMITGQWWPAAFPGIAIGLSVFGFAAASDGLGRLIDPQQRKIRRPIETAPQTAGR